MELLHPNTALLQLRELILLFTSHVISSKSFNLSKSLVNEHTISPHKLHILHKAQYKSGDEKILSLNLLYFAMKFKK
jgi:hypothetical protein